MTVGDYLRIPYLVTAQSVELPNGDWLRHVEHPELPGCVAEADSITEALNRLEVLRIETVLSMLADGQEPPVRQSLLGETQSRQRAARAGLGDRVTALWEQDPESLVRS